MFAHGKSRSKRRGAFRSSKLQPGPASKRPSSHEAHPGKTSTQPFMKWSSELELGLEVIDRQHRWLVHATNALHIEMHKDPREYERLDTLIRGLLLYVRQHFAVEERLFKRYGYPQTEAHLKEREHFTVAVEEWQSRHQAGEALSMEVLGFLKHWLLYHILRSDKAYVPFLKEQGMQ